MCHGKAAPLRKMSAGDYFIYYSPVDKFRSKEKLQSFTAIGKVIDGDVYQFEISQDFKPYRCDVKFYQNFKDVHISKVKSQLSITQGNYGMLFRRGHLEMPESDFIIIANSMGISLKQN